MIADTEALHFETFRDVLREEGIALDRGAYDARYLGLNDRLGFEMALRESGHGPDERRVLSLVGRKSRVQTSRIGEVALFAGVADLVRELAGALPLGIGSGGRRDEIQTILRAHGIAECFRVLKSADDVERSKPAPDTFLAVHEALREQTPDLDAQHCLVIEDSRQGIDAAIAAGMPCVAVAHTYEAARLDRATRVVGNIAELSLARLRELFR